LVDGLVLIVSWICAVAIFVVVVFGAVALFGNFGELLIRIWS